MIQPPNIRAAKALIRAHNRERKPQRSKAAAPRHVNAPTRVHDKPYLAFLRRQPCHIGPACQGSSDPCHIRMGKPSEAPTGMGRKPDDRRAVPMCRAHHDEQHRNERAFWARRGEDPFTVAEGYYARFEREAK